MVEGQFLVNLERRHAPQPRPLRAAEQHREAPFPIRDKKGPVHHSVLAISKDKKQLLVVELKKGRASDVVVGQTLRYMGYVQEELAEEGQSVIGVIIALEDDPRIRRALRMTPTIEFFPYQISFKLVKGGGEHG